MREAVGQGPRLVRQRLFEAGDFLLPLPDLLVGLGGDGVRFLARLEGGFLAQCSASRSAWRIRRSASACARASVSSAMRRRDRSHQMPARRPTGRGRPRERECRRRGKRRQTERPVVPMRLTVLYMKPGEGLRRWCREANARAVERKAPLCRVGRSDEPARAGGTAAQAALQASSCRGMHTTQRRDSLGLEHWLKRASEPSRAKQGT